MKCSKWDCLKVFTNKGVLQITVKQSRNSRRKLWRTEKIVRISSIQLNFPGMAITVNLTKFEVLKYRKFFFLINCVHILLEKTFGCGKCLYLDLEPVCCYGNYSSERINAVMEISGSNQEQTTVAFSAIFCSLEFDLNCLEKWDYLM